MTVLVFGSINMDLTTYVPRLPSAGETLLGHSFAIVPGGKGANQAVAAARLGAPTRMVGRIGDDAFGREAAIRLRAEGVDTSSIDIDNQHATGLAVINVDDKAENTIIVVSGANMTLDDDDAERCIPLLDQAKVLLLQLETPLGPTMAVARAAQERDVLVVLDPAPASNIPMAFYPLLDVITPNETEAKALVGFWPSTHHEAERAAQQLLERGAKAAVIKMGARGACYADANGVDFIKPFPVVALDTVAAGDAFNGGLAVALAEGRSLKEAVRWASAAGAVSVTRQGALPSMPTREDVEDLINS